MGGNRRSETPAFVELADVLLSSAGDGGTGPGARSIAAVLGLVEVRPGHAPPVADAGGTAAKMARARTRGGRLARQQSSSRSPTRRQPSANNVYLAEPTLRAELAAAPA